MAQGTCLLMDLRATRSTSFSKVKGPMKKKVLELRAQ